MKIGDLVLVKRQGYNRGGKFGGMIGIIVDDLKGVEPLVVLFPNGLKKAYGIAALEVI